MGRNFITNLLSEQTLYNLGYLTEDVFKEEATFPGSQLLFNISTFLGYIQLYIQGLVIT